MSWIWPTIARDGFVNSLRLNSPDQTRMAAARAAPTSSNYTVFTMASTPPAAMQGQSEEAAAVASERPPRIIHDQGEKMMYFEDARLEFFGTPLAWLPYFPRRIRPSSARPA